MKFIKSTQIVKYHLKFEVICACYNIFAMVASKATSCTVSFGSDNFDVTSQRINIELVSIQYFFDTRVWYSDRIFLIEHYIVANHLICPLI